MTDCVVCERYIPLSSKNARLLVLPDSKHLVCNSTCLSEGEKLIAKRDLELSEEALTDSSSSTISKEAPLTIQKSHDAQNKLRTKVRTAPPAIKTSSTVQKKETPQAQREDKIKAPTSPLLMSKKLLFFLSLLSFVGFLLGFEDSSFGRYIYSLLEWWVLFSIPLVIQLIYIRIFS